MGDGAAARQQQLKDFAVPVGVENETKSWSFLETRAQLLLKAYSATIAVNLSVVVGLIIMSVQSERCQLTLNMMSNILLCCQMKTLDGVSPQDCS